MFLLSLSLIVYSLTPARAGRIARKKQKDRNNKSGA